MKWKLPAYIAGIGIIAAGTFGTGVYFSKEVKQAYSGLQKSVSCFYSPENCATRDKIKQSYVSSEDKCAGKIKKLEEEVQTLQQKSISVDPKQVDTFFKQYNERNTLQIIVPLDTLMQALSSNYGKNPFAKYCVDTILEEGKKEFKRKLRNTQESIDGVIDSTKKTIMQKLGDYGKKLSDTIYPNYQNKLENKLDGGR